MLDKYKIRGKDKAYFITMTAIEWVNIFICKNQKLAFVNSLDYCIKNKVLVIFAYVIMYSRIHMICRAENEKNRMLSLNKLLM